MKDGQFPSEYTSERLTPYLHSQMKAVFIPNQATMRNLDENTEYVCRRCKW